ncbi:MAG: hypothetical protein NVSMB47_16560 [Polyangiales bacterium]
MPLLASLLGVLLGCPAEKSKSSADPPSTCTRIGDACMFAPGKLGLCIEPLDGGATPVCQSQH